MTDHSLDVLPHTDPSVLPPPVRKRPAGFTLMEMWVGLLIVVTISAVSLAALRGRTKVQTLRRGRDLIAADLRLMQQWSLGGKTASICVYTDPQGTKYDRAVCRSGADCAATYQGSCQYKVPQGGYGAKFVRCNDPNASCSYQLYADLDGAGDYDAAELLDAGTRTMERPLRTSQLTVTMRGCTEQYDCVGATCWQSVAFALYSGTTMLRGVSSCAGYDSTRVQQAVTIGPEVTGSTVQVIAMPGIGGIRVK